MSIKFQNFNFNIEKNEEVVSFTDPDEGLENLFSKINDIMKRIKTTRFVYEKKELEQMISTLYFVEFMKNPNFINNIDLRFIKNNITPYTI